VSLFTCCIFSNCKNSAPKTVEGKISSYQLVSEFIANEEKANEIYKDKRVEVEGVIQEINALNQRNTIFLVGKQSSSSVLCDFNYNRVEEIKRLRKGQRIKLKGVCKGFLNDVILLNCTLINTPINE